MEAVGSLLCHGHISSWLCSCVDKMLDWPHQSLHVCVSIALIQWIPLRAKSLSKYLATSNFSLQTPTQSQVFTPTLSYWALQLPDNYLSFSLEGWRNSEWMMYSFIMCWIVNRISSTYVLLGRVQCFGTHGMGEITVCLYIWALHNCICRIYKMGLSLQSLTFTPVVHICIDSSSHTVHCCIVLSVQWAKSWYVVELGTGFNVLFLWRETQKEPSSVVFSQKTRTFSVFKCGLGKMTGGLEM